MADGEATVGTTVVGMAAVAPTAAAIGVFGIVYGALARPVLGAPLTIASSALVFSGAAQFAMVGLLGTGASAAAVLWAVVVLNLRYPALGAVIRSRLQAAGPLERAGLACFLIDETVGLALVDRTDPARTLWRAGLACYLAFLAGTVLGVLGAALPLLELFAASVFPVLFIGLTAISVRDRGSAVRAAAAGAIVAVAVVVLPGVAGMAPVVAAVAVASAGGRG